MFLIKENVMYKGKTLVPGDKSALDGVSEKSISGMLERGDIEEVKVEKSKPVAANKAKGDK